MSIIKVTKWIESVPMHESSPTIRNFFNCNQEKYLLVKSALRISALILKLVVR